MSAPPTATLGSATEHAETPAQSVGDEVQASTAALMPMASHSHNAIDPYFYNHARLVQFITWSSTQAKNTTLANFQISPHFMDTLLKYQSAIYNMWSGDFEFSFHFAGTGFQGGKVIAFKIPPNMDPDEITIMEATMFPNCIMDPKMLAPVGLVGTDTKNVMAHWTITGSDSPRSRDYIGGTLCLRVFNELFSAALENTFCTISVWVRPAPNFTLSQIIPPRITSLNYDNYPTFGRFASPDTYGSPMHPLVPLELTYIYVPPNTSASVEVWRGVDFLFNLDGTPLNSDYRPMSWWNGISNTVRNPGKNQAQFVTSNNTKFRFAVQPNGNDGAVDAMWYRQTDSVSAGTLTIQTIDYSRGPAVAVITFFTNIDNSATGVVASNPDDDQTFLAAPFVNPNVTTGPQILAPNGEKIVYFGHAPTYSVNALGCLMPRHETSLIAQGLFKDLNRGETPVFSVKDATSQATMGYFRLNPQGYFSTNHSASTWTAIGCSKFYLSYLETIGQNELLPTINPVTMRMASLENRLAQL